MAKVEIVDERKMEQLPYGAKLDMNAKGFYQPKVSIHGTDLDDVTKQAVDAALALEGFAEAAGLPIQQQGDKKVDKK
jgi:hypothetical protein